VRLVSGEDSITSSDAAEELGLEVALVLVLGLVVVVLVVLEDVLDEQAARPIPRRPAAATASALLLVIPLTVNFDPFLSVNAISRRTVFLGGLARAIRVERSGRL
jgi:hypothetical protein